ncbi:MAG: hypothetical protein DMG32_21730 [Acidobacteria bacterium]|nr:MAG: hypothetical protein DMG32_21730 [Acidobacteriota bacterium]
MNKINTEAMGRIENFKGQKLTIGLDLGDRFSHYCILNESGEVIGEHHLPTIPKGIDEVFGRIPRSRIGLETGTHSPWVSRQLGRLGHEVIVAHARNASGTGPCAHGVSEHRTRVDEIVWGGHLGIDLLGDLLDPAVLFRDPLVPGARSRRSSF